MSTTPLQQAHDAAVAASEAEPAPAPFIPTVAGPRAFFPTGIYDGAELSRQPVRPGAQDAYRMPSLFNGRRSAPGEDLRRQAVTHWAPPPAAPAPAMPPPRASSTLRKPKTTIPLPAEAAHRTVRPLAAFPQRRRQPAEVWTPRADSMPALLIGYLQKNGGHMTFKEIARRYGTLPNSMESCMRKPFGAGLLIRLRIGAQSAAALPGYELPEGAYRVEVTDRQKAAQEQRSKRLEQLRQAASS